MKSSLIDIEQYVEQTAKIINLNIVPDYLPRVVENLNKIQENADLVMEFELPETIESAPIFKP